MGLELALAARAVQGEISVFFLIDVARVNELRHQTRRHLAGGILLLQLQDLLLELLDLQHLCLMLCLLLRSCFLLLPDLCLSPSAFAALLEHVSGDTLGYYRITLSSY